MKVLLVNIFDIHYGLTYRARLIRKILAGMGHNCLYVESNFREYDTALGPGYSVKQGHNLLSYLWAALARMCLAFRLDYDVCLVHKALPVNILPVIAALLRRKRVILDWDDLEAYFQVSFFRKKLILFFEKIFAGLPIEFAVHSSFIETYIKNISPAKIHYLPQAIDDVIFNGSPTDKYRKKYGLSGKTVCGYVATFTIGSLYDFERMLDLYERFAARFDNMVLLIAGGGVLGDYAQRAVDNRKRDDIFLVGMLDRREVAYFLASCDICLIAMSEGHLSNEARVSLKALEYAAAGKPIVGNLVGESYRILGDCAHPVDSVCIDAMLAGKGNCSHLLHARQVVEAGFSRQASQAALAKFLDIRDA